MNAVEIHGRTHDPRPSLLANTRHWVGGSFAPYLFILPFFVVFAAFGFYPLAYAFRLSLTYWHGSGAPRYIGLSNYAFLLTDSLFWQSITNSALLWLMIVPIQTLFSVLIAVALSAKSLRVRWFFRTSFLAPYVMPLVAVAQIWLIFFDGTNGAVNTLLQFVHIPAVSWLTSATWAKPTMALMVLWKNCGFSIVLMLAALQSIPEDIYEASAIDGASAVIQFWRITVPLLRRTISFFVIIATLGVLQMFAEPYVLTQGGPFNSTVTAGYHLLDYINNADFGTGAANSFLLMILVIAIALLLPRLLRTGSE